MKIIIEKSIVCTCDFFNNNSSCKCNSFSPMLTRKTYFISLGTKLLSLVRDDSTDWVRDDLTGNETKGYETTMGTKRLGTKRLWIRKNC